MQSMSSLVTISHNNSKMTSLPPAIFDCTILVAMSDVNNKEEARRKTVVNQASFQK